MKIRVEVKHCRSMLEINGIYIRRTYRDYNFKLVSNNN